MNASPHERRQELLARIAEPGIDLDRAAQRVAATRAGDRRRRRNRALLLCSAVVLLVVAVVGALLASNSADEVVADGELTTTTTTTTEAPDGSDESDESDGEPSTETDDGSSDDSDEIDPSVLEALPVEPPPARPPALVTPDPAPPATAAPLPIPAPTPDEPLVLRVAPAAPGATAGDLVTLEIAWLDADHVGGAPRIRIDWGDPLLQPVVLGPEAPDCTGAARPAGAVEQARARFASAGRRTVRVEAVSCDGPAGTPQRALAESVIEVNAPSFAGAPAHTVVAHAVPGSPVPAPLDQAIASFRPLDGPAIGLGQRRPTLDQQAGGGPATVVVVPGFAAGRLELLWPGQGCRATAELSAAPAGSARLVPLTIDC